MPSRRTGRVEPHGRGWRFQVKIGGQRVRRSFATREEAEVALRKLLAEVEHDEAAELRAKVGPLTVGELVHLYLERRRPHLEDSTMSRYDNVVAKHVIPGIGAYAAAEIAQTPLLIEDWLATVPSGSARKALEVLGPAFRMAVDNGLVPTDPIAKIRRPPPLSRKRKKEIPTPAEVEKIVIAAYEEDIWWGYFVELSATLGSRRAETSALRWEDFDFPNGNEEFGVIHIRRAVGKRKGGIYLKAPKSSLERDLVAHRSLFEGLDGFRGETGWLFPGRDIRPRREEGLTRSSSPGRLLLHLLDADGELVSSSGLVGADCRRAIGVNSATFSVVIRELLSDGLIERDANARRTFRLALTATGLARAAALSESPDEVALPWHPDTAGHRFEALVKRLGITTPTGRSYTLHSLRHYRATHQYNRTKDWVQVAKYMGHTSPAITMELYANNVVSTTQADLARAAVGL